MHVTNFGRGARRRAIRIRIDLIVLRRRPVKPAYGTDSVYEALHGSEAQLPRCTADPMRRVLYES